MNQLKQVSSSTKYQLKSRFLKLGSNYRINDENGNSAFVVKGKFLSFGHDLSFQMSDGTEVARIRQKLFRLFPQFEMYLGAKHKPFATITQEWSWLKKRFSLDVPGPNDYTIEGNFWSYEYEFRRKNRTVARVSRSFFSLCDSYGVEIEKGEDDVAILSAMVVVSLCNQAEGHT